MRDGNLKVSVDSGEGHRSELCFSLKFWALWQSVPLSTHNCWPGGEVLPFDDGSPDVSFLPMMQRRRLSPLARAVCAVAWRGRQSNGDMPTIFFSRHGESQYYFEMLQGMAAGESVSPARFSLCVHNAIAGLFSFQTHSFLPYVSLAGGTEDLFGAFIEAAGQLLDVPKVMLICYEQPLPQIYRNYVPSLDMTWALAMVLGRAEDTGFRLRLSRDISNGASLTQGYAFDFVNAIVSGQYSGCIELERSVWHWDLQDA